MARAVDRGLGRSIARWNAWRGLSNCSRGNIAFKGFLALIPEKGSNFKWVPRGHTSFFVFIPIFIFLKVENLHHSLTIIYHRLLMHFHFILGIQHSIQIILEICLCHFDDSPLRPQGSLAPQLAYTSPYALVESSTTRTLFVPARSPSFASLSSSFLDPPKPLQLHLSTSMNHSFKV